MHKIQNNKPVYHLIIPLSWTLLTFAILTTSYISNAFIRKVFSAPMLLFIPGYILTLVIYPRKNQLEIIERLALSVSSSIISVPLLGVYYNFTSGINLTSLITTLCLFTTILILIATYRLGKLTDEERLSVPFQHILEIIQSESNIHRTATDRISLGLLIFLITLATGMLYFVITTPGIGERFTEFYILGHDGKADNYTTGLKLNSPSHIIVGVANHEYTRVNFTLKVVLENDILTDTLFRLDHNEIWEKNLTFVPDKSGENMKLEFLLYKEDNFTNVYRELHMWVNVSK